MSPSLWVRLPLPEAYKVRQLVRKRRPLGRVLRELVLRGLEMELAEIEEEKQRRVAAREAPMDEASPAAL